MFWLALWLSAASTPPPSAPAAGAALPRPAVPAEPSGVDDPTPETVPAAPGAVVTAGPTLAAVGRSAAAKMGPPGRRVTACSAPLRIALAPALIIELKGWPAGAVTRAALGKPETPVAGPPVPIRVVIVVCSLVDVAGLGRRLGSLVGRVSVWLRDFVLL